MNVLRLNKLFYQHTLSCIEGKIIHSSMAVVNTNYEHFKNICPENIEIICHNSKNSSVVCGPPEFVQELMKKLQVKIALIFHKKIKNII